MSNGLLIPITPGSEAATVNRATEYIAPFGNPVDMFKGIELLWGNFSEDDLRAQFIPGPRYSEMASRYWAVSEGAGRNQSDSQEHIIRLGAGIILNHVADKKVFDDTNLIATYVSGIHKFSHLNRSLNVLALSGVELLDRVRRLMDQNERRTAKKLVEYAQAADVGTSVFDRLNTGFEFLRFRRK